jgi:4-amino-4-deoxy-L-arabinose transferase-like glycosyltransferase
VIESSDGKPPGAAEAVTRRGPLIRRSAAALRERLFRLRYPLLIILVVNAILLAGYFWSRGGQTTHVRVISEGPSFQAFVDGKLMSKQRIDDAPPAGGIVLAIENTQKISSLPKPRGIDRIRVTDTKLGTVLFEDDFSHGLGNTWEMAAGYAVNDHGVLDVRDDGSVILADRAWSDVTVDVDFKNVVGAAVMLRAQDAKTGVVYSLRPFRQYDSNLALIRGGDVVTSFTGGQVFPNDRQTFKSMFAMILKPYPFAALLLVSGLVIVSVLQFLDVLWAGRSLAPGRAAPLWFVMAFALSVAAFGVTAYLMSAYTDRVPHVQDDVSYVFQAKILASGHLSAPAPPVIEAFDIANPPFVVAVDGKWASVYPFGHPLALAFGEVFGAMWIVPPLLGAATIFLTFAIGRKVYDASTGLLAALLLASSPFFFMTASNFMSHNTAAFYLLMCVLLLVLTGTRRRQFLYGLAAGVFYGLMFNTQQLSAVALVAPLGVCLLARLVPTTTRKDEVIRLGGFIAGGALALAAYLLYNLAVRGDPLLTGNAAAGFPSSVGFGGAHSVNNGILNEHIQLTFMLLVLDGWPVWIGLTFIVALLALGTRNVWDYFFLSCAVFLIGAYTLFIGHGTMYGPRYWYPAVPLLMLLTARGAHRAAEVIAEGAAVVRRAMSGTDRPARWAARLAVYAVIAALIGSSISSWLLSRHIGWRADFVPETAVALQQFNGADDRLSKEIDKAHLKNALVLVDECPSWQCYGTVFWRNSPTLDGDYVIARNLPSRLSELFRAYPNRSVYVATYVTPALAPYGFSAATAIGRPLSDFPPAPHASGIPIPTPTATATPEGGGDASARDEQRKQDLALIAGGLQQYKVRHGSYPEALGLQSFCRYAADAGCKLEEVLGALPKEPNQAGTYYYLSDRATFTVFAVMEEASDDSACPHPLPSDLSSVEHLFCVRG